MNLLWLGIALLLLPALWFLSLPLRRSRTTWALQRQFETDDRADEQNVSVYQRRLTALEAARERGEIDPARFEESRLELDRNLLEDTEARRRAPLRRPLAGRFLIPLAMVAIVAASTVGYRWIGSAGDLALYAVQQEVLNSPDGSLSTLIDRLEEQAEYQPANPSVWESLFPLYRESGQFDLAVGALERLTELDGRRPDLLAQLAQMKFFAAGRTLTDEVRALVDETLDKDPRQPTVLGILGIEAFDNAQYEQAIGYWRRAVAGFEDAESADALRNGIAVAQQRLGQDADESGAAAEAKVD
jgi:cytochrome c-type biogenesis protein CcmH